MNREHQKNVQQLAQQPCLDRLLGNSLLVHKYGGSSMGSIEKIAHVATRIEEARVQTHQIVVVVSAMQGETDRLLSLAHAVTERPDPREADQLLATGEQAAAALLAITLRHRGIPARSLTGPQMGIFTDGAFSKARITHIDKEVLQKTLSRGEVVVATGFQGIDREGNLTTLGRGGSDTSAVALAAALGAKECEIYTDVDGVYTADPRICPTATKINEITFEEMLEMASQGSKVLQLRSVEVAMNHNVPLRVRSTFDTGEGTLVRADQGEEIERVNVRGISHHINEAKITLRQVPDQPGIAATIFSGLAAAKINVDVIVQNSSEAGSTDLSFTISEGDRLQCDDIIRTIAKDIGARDVEMDSEIAKVSIVGVGMRSHAGVAAQMFLSLKEAKVNIQMITTSEIKITCVIAATQVITAVNALHDTFKLARSGALEE